MDHLFPYPKMGSSFLEILQDPLTRKLVGHKVSLEEDALPFMLGLTTRFEFLLRNPVTHHSFLKIGYSALEAFLQSNCTGPPLDFNSEEIIIPKLYRREDGSLAELKKQLLQSLAVDGTTVYALAPNIELFWLAKVIMSNAVLAEEGFNGRRARIRVNFIHQKLLLEKSDLLQAQISTDVEVLEQQLTSRLKFRAHAAEEYFVEFLLERAAICTYYGDEEVARRSLAHAAKIRDFQFALTGVLGKRTKFQDTEVSQLIVLAKSRDFEPEPYSSQKSSPADGGSSHTSNSAANSRPTTLAPTSVPAGPTNVPLNDDTLLEAISFKQTSVDKSAIPTVSSASSLPPALASLDPAHQPLLFPVDSIILLAMASSISNTSPADGLTREETLPYATRVLEGGSSNWQVYSQALLVRSRIEGYRSRTAERGLLQLQALVDQVIAETTSSNPQSVQDSPGNDPTTTTTTAHQPTSFLPRPKSAESATPAERLRYIYQLSPPLRWELESELAARWVSLGGLKTALEIYERLEMFAEVALCLAGTEREAEAVRVIRTLLFEPSEQKTNAKAEADIGRDVPYTGPERIVLPADAPRLLCILGDLEDEPSHYERAWTVSKGRYARAQRSLGRYWAKRKQYTRAAEAYSKSLEVNKLNARTWFALGCVQLELQDWAGAVESFSKTVQLETEDAEALSNLAAALLRLPAEGDDKHVESDSGEAAAEEPDDVVEGARELSLTDAEANAGEDDVDTRTTKPDPYKNTRDALSALRRAAQLKRDNVKIWDNYLTVAASLPPPWTPWSEIILAQKRVIELCGKTKGESSVDEKIVGVLVAYVTSEFDYPTAAELEREAVEAQPHGGAITSIAAKEAALPTATLRPGSVPRELIDLMENYVMPLITTSSDLWLSVARLATWRKRPLVALEANEKAWRAATSQPGVYERDEASWEAAVVATEALVKAYEGLVGEERERTGGKVIDGDWKFKARSAVRSVLRKGREVWGDSDGFRRLENIMETLKGLA
jgi:tetratricopeptide (TPR) repeat protein